MKINISEIDILKRNSYVLIQVRRRNLLNIAFVTIYAIVFLCLRYLKVRRKRTYN